MTDDDKALVERLRTKYCCSDWADDCNCDEAADRIDALEAENERLREALKIADQYIDDLEQHEGAEGFSVSTFELGSRYHASRAALGETEKELVKVLTDAAFYGTGFMKDGKHIPLEDIYIDPRDARIEAQAAEIERLREWSLKAFTIVEWVVGEGKLLEYPCYDADDMLGDGVELLGVYSADDARAALGETK